MGVCMGPPAAVLLRNSGGSPEVPELPPATADRQGRGRSASCVPTAPAPSEHLDAHVATRPLAHIRGQRTHLAGGLRQVTVEARVVDETPQGAGSIVDF